MTIEKILQMLNDRYKDSYITFTVDNSNRLYANSLQVDEEWKYIDYKPMPMINDEVPLISMEDYLLIDLFQKVDNFVKKYFIVI
jgi:hypothetical protein